MRRGFIRIAGAAVVAAAAATPGAIVATSGAAASRSCGPVSAATLVHSSVARIYTPDRVHSPAPPGLLFPRVYGCLFGSSRVVSLGGGGRQQVVLPTLAGHFAGYGLRQMGVDTGSTTVRVVALRSGATVVNAAVTSPVTRPESSTVLDALVLNAHGHVAWIGSKGSIVGRGPTAFEVHRIERSGAALLDSGTKIDPGSLRRHGRRISWRDAGKTRAAMLN